MQPWTRFMTNSAAQSAFDLPTSLGLCEGSAVAYACQPRFLAEGTRRHGPSGCCAPEEELPVQIGDVDRVHVDDMNVGEPKEGEVGEDLAAESAGAWERAYEGQHGYARVQRLASVLTDDEDFALLAEEALRLLAALE